MNSKQLVLAVSLLLFSYTAAFSAEQLAEDGSLIAFDNGTVIDTATNLMWSQSDNGSDLSWIDAVLYAQSFSLASHKDWRLPTKEELAGLIRNKPNNSGLKMSPLFQIESIFLYSSDTKVCKATFTDLSTGSHNWVIKSRPDFGRVLLVRNNNK